MTRCPAARFLRGGVECRRGPRTAAESRSSTRQIAEIARAAVRAGAANAGGEKRAFRPAARDPRWVPNPARPSRCRRVLLDRVPPAHAGLREPLPVLSSRSGRTLRTMTCCARVGAATVCELKRFQSTSWANRATVAPRCVSAASQNSSTMGCFSSTDCTMPRCTPLPRP